MDTAKLKQDLLTSCDRIDAALHRFKNRTLSLTPQLEEERNAAWKLLDNLAWECELAKMVMHNFDADQKDQTCILSRPAGSFYTDGLGIAVCTKCERRISDCSCYQESTNA
jgi:hypothetical protein